MSNVQSEVNKLLQPISGATDLELEQIKEDLRITKFKLQEILDELEGKRKASNVVEYRDVYVYNDWGILDGSHDLIMDFELVENMTKLVGCWVSFRTRNYSSPITLGV